MKKLKKPVLFALTLIPAALAGGLFTALYQLDLYDPAILANMVTQVGSVEMILLVSVIQIAVYTFVCGFIGYILANKIGLLRPFRFQKANVLRTLFISVVAGMLFSLDYWTFGKAVPEIAEATKAGLTVYAILASILYGGILEEVMLRLFMLSLIAWLLWKLFCRKWKIIPNGVFIVANCLTAFLFAAGHLPATYMAFGGLTPLLLVRCFLFNGGLGLVFGWLYRKYGVQYAMLSHAAVHAVSKAIWLFFL